MGSGRSFYLLVQSHVNGLTKIRFQASTQQHILWRDNVGAVGDTQNDMDTIQPLQHIRIPKVLNTEPPTSAYTIQVQ